MRPRATTTRSREHPEPTPTQFGVGCRFSLQVMSDRFVEVILGALSDADPGDLEITTDDVSTYVAGGEQAILTFLRDVLVAATRRLPGGHLSTTVLLSRGCPGEITCELPEGAAPPATGAVALDPTGVDVAAHWSLYPLGVSGHLPVIERAVGLARAAGTHAGGEHYATRLEGDLADVLATAANGWLEVGREVPHVTTHLTVSIGSPTRGGAS